LAIGRQSENFVALATVLGAIILGDPGAWVSEDEAQFDALPYSLLFTVFEAVLKRFQRFSAR